MKRFCFLLLIIFIYASTAHAQETTDGITKVFARSKTTKEESAQIVVDHFNNLVKSKGKFQLGNDQFERSIQVIVQSKEAYPGIYALSITIVAFNGSCFCYYNGYVAPVNKESLKSEATNIYYYIVDRIKELYLLM